MKTFQLKLISILILALAMTANADILKLSVNGNTTIEECTMRVGDIAVIDVYCTLADYPYECFVCIVDGPGEWTGYYIIYPQSGCEIIDIYQPLDECWGLTYTVLDPDVCPILPGKHAEFEYLCLGPGDVVIDLEDAAGEPVDYVTIHQVAPDLGDAPDSSNNFDTPMTAYPSTGVEAHYPTVFNDGNNLNPRGPIHKQPLAVAYLGQGVSGELEADSGWDEDPNNNINPQANIANQDGADDCITDNVVWLLDPYPSRFNFQVTAVSPNVPLYVNVWFDWNQDGDWDDPLEFCGNPTPEWAVQNQQLLFSEAGFYNVSSEPFMPWDSLQDPTHLRYIWMRITLSEQPWTGTGSGGSGPPGGYQYGETEDHLIQVLFPSYCFPPGHPDFCEWLEVGGPTCWCYPRQCHGDADDTSEGVKSKGRYYVHYKDLCMLLGGWNVREPPQGPGIKWPNTQICADFAHDTEYVKGKGYYRVHFKDIGILLANWNVREPPQGPGIEPNCLDVP